MAGSFETIILGIIQGLTEWFPVSSSGHLKLAEYFLGLSAPVFFEVVLHIGTLAVVLFYFRDDIKGILLSAFHRDFKSEQGRLVPLIVVGTVPTAVIGMVMHELDVLENVFRSPLPVAAAYLVCGMILYAVKNGEQRTGDVGYLAALAIGVFQGVAVIPGISRSGATIAIALLLGVKRERAFIFSFLLSIPATLGAFGLTVSTQLDEMASSGLGPVEIVLGVVSAMIVGYITLNVLRKILSGRRLHVFSWYCWLLGATVIMLSLAGL